MLRSGVPILQSLEIVGETSGNLVLERAAKDVQESVRKGDSLAGPLADHKVFPAMMVQMLAVGEDTGAMDTMLGKLADFYDQEVEATTEALTEPDRAADDRRARRHDRVDDHRPLHAHLQGLRPDPVTGAPQRPATESDRTMRIASRTRAAERGFTLIELLVVVVDHRRTRGDRDPRVPGTTRRGVRRPGEERRPQPPDGDRGRVPRGPGLSADREHPDLPEVRDHQSRCLLRLELVVLRVGPVTVRRRLEGDQWCRRGRDRTGCMQQPDGVVPSSVRSIVRACRPRQALTHL